MSGYGQAIGYAHQKVSNISSVRPARKIRKEKKMKLTFRQRIRNWLMRDELEEDVPQLVSTSEGLSSEGMRMQIYRASGGYVVETRNYDSHKDRHFNTMHVITEDQDLGEKLGQIVMVEALKR
jgi:hypothetical protein